MTKLDVGLMTSLPASDPGSAAVWGSKRINPRPQFCLCLSWSGYPSNDDDDDDPQLIYTYPPSASSIPSPQTQHTISPLTQSSFHPSSPSRNNFRILQWNANGIRPRRTELIQFLSHNQYDLIFIQESHLSSDSTFCIPGYKNLQKNRSTTRRGATNSTGNLEGGVLILVKNGLTYTSLSTQSLSSLDPSSDYLAIAVKVKGASPIHLFNVYVPPI